MVSDERTGRILIEQLGRYAWHGEETCVTVDVHFWRYHGERGALTFVEGNRTADEATEIVNNGEHKREFEQSGKCSDCPRYFNFACRAEELLKIARTILKTYEPTADQIT